MDEQRLILVVEDDDAALPPRGRARLPIRRTHSHAAPFVEKRSFKPRSCSSYVVEEIRRRRRGGRPPMGSAAASVESVRLDPELKRELLLHAAEQQISVPEAIRQATAQYLRAS